jgi:S1-C subfamily serine protease
VLAQRLGCALAGAVPRQVAVRLSDGRVMAADVVAADDQSDIAVLPWVQ